MYGRYGSSELGWARSSETAGMGVDWDRNCSIPIEVSGVDCVSPDFDSFLVSDLSVN